MLELYVFALHSVEKVKKVCLCPNDGQDKKEYNHLKGSNHLFNFKSRGNLE